MLLQELAQLKQRRAPQMPPIMVLFEDDPHPRMPEIDHWATLKVKVPFAATNDILGVQLDCSIT
jgi:hypothetical protein